jgi:hypothetical protein
MLPERRPAKGRCSLDQTDACLIFFLVGLKRELRGNSFNSRKKKYKYFSSLSEWMDGDCGGNGRGRDIEKNQNSP